MSNIDISDTILASELIDKSPEYTRGYYDGAQAGHDLRDSEVSELQAQLTATQTAANNYKGLYEREMVFYEWAQTYLDGGRWAGHDLSDAIKTELLERDAQLSQAEAATVERCCKIVENYEADGYEFGCGIADAIRRAFANQDTPAGKE